MTSSQHPENASSGLIDTGFVLRFEPLYELSDLEAEIFDDIAPKVVRREGYKRKNFLKVVEWKAVAVLPTAQELSGDDIDYVTGVALDEDTPNHLRLPFLKVLPGVGNPLASALLTVFDPKKYSILDSRAVGVLHDHGLLETPNPSRVDYTAYRKLMKSLAKGANCAPLDLYRALIAYSRQPQG
ncbi:Uncharacterised protein [Brevibacterium casei]|uniref:Uncharacterized protein n=1 Tax=Brevibacterium casei TaxID=33889 RepID=A0A449D8I5_9MICO|nr:hypothetical protein [Brevibacterium casei]VEW13872.1 Uncharacterised protein [Brevibacterium casei]